ncbi:MAG: rhodanese-like domain-containing protein [Bacteroidia bacterium]
MLNQSKNMTGGLFQSAGKSSYANISSAEFQEKLIEKDAVILDVRTVAEFKSGHISGAINADIMSSDFGQKIQSLDKNKILLVYCQSGGRSASACSNLHNIGFEKVYNLIGGIMSYRGKIV